jgi:hypothetical protein
VCDFISFVFSRVQGVHRLVTGFGAATHRRIAQTGRWASLFASQNYCARAEMFQLILFLACENRAENDDGQGFRC